MACPLCADFLVPAALVILGAFCIATLI